MEQSPKRESHRPGIFVILAGSLPGIALAYIFGQSFLLLSAASAFFCWMIWRKAVPFHPLPDLKYRCSQAYTPFLILAFTPYAARLLPALPLILLFGCASLVAHNTVALSI